MKKSIKLTDFKRGDLIRFIPPQANGNKDHPDCEDGIVVGRSKASVRCRFITRKGNLAGRWRNLANSESCSPEDLIILVSEQDY